MPRAGTRIENRFGESIIFQQTSAETQCKSLEVEVVYRPQAPLPPMHYHPLQWERFEVRAGQTGCSTRFSKSKQGGSNRAH